MHRRRNEGTLADDPKGRGRVWNESCYKEEEEAKHDAQVGEFSVQTPKSHFFVGPAIMVKTLPFVLLGSALDVTLLLKANATWITRSSRFSRQYCTFLVER
jgi:hypothetical protein